MSTNHLEDIAGEVVRQALEGGASDAECTLAEGSEFSVSVRMRQVENIKEAGSRGAGLRVMKGLHAGSAYTSDLSAEGLRELVRSAIELAGISSEDPHAGLPSPEELGAIAGDLQLFHEDVDAADTPARIRMALEAEAAALDLDPRIRNSEGAGFDSYSGRRVFANSRGFAGSYRASQCSLSAVPVAKEGDAMERDYWFSAARSLAGLEAPAEVGRTAARRALRRLGARKVATGKYPVVFEPRSARSLIENIYEAVHGEAIYRKASFLAGRLGETVASQQLTVIDDGTLPGLFGTSPFDDEGVPTRRTALIEKGVLKSYLLNCYTARKLGLKTTGSASRSLAGNPGIGHANLFALAGQSSPEEIIGSVKSGFYVTELIGFGVNIVTGDYSRGAVGMWIDNGELAYPVSEVTIAGNLREMLLGVDMAGSDLEFRGSAAAPTLRIGEMTVSGR